MLANFISSMSISNKQFATLCLINMNSANVPTEIAEIQNRHGPAITRDLNHLKSLGYVEIQKNGRFHKCTITNEGKKAINAITSNNSFEESFKNFMEDLGQKYKKQAKEEN